MQQNQFFKNLLAVTKNISKRNILPMVTKTENGKAANRIRCCYATNQGVRKNKENCCKFGEKLSLLHSFIKRAYNNNSHLAHVL